MAWGRLLTRLLGFVSVVSCLVLGVGLPLTRWLELRHLHALKSARSVANSTTPPVRVINSECKCKKRPPCSGAGLGWVLDQHGDSKAEWLDVARGRMAPPEIRAGANGNGGGGGQGIRRSHGRASHWALQGALPPDPKGKAGSTKPEDQPLVPAVPSCRYQRLETPAARCSLRGLRIAFIGDSPLRNLFENFSWLLDRGRITPLNAKRRGGSNSLPVKWGDFLLADGRRNISLLFHWAPLITHDPAHDPINCKQLAGKLQADCGQIAGQIAPRPFAAALAALLEAGRGTKPEDAVELAGSKGAKDRHAAGMGQLCPAWLGGIDYNGYATKGAEPLVADNRPLPNGGGWLSYCRPPDVLVLNYGLWHKAGHERNLAALEAMLQSYYSPQPPETAARVNASAGSGGDRDVRRPLLVLVLPWRVRRHWSKPFSVRFCRCSQRTCSHNKHADTLDVLSPGDAARPRAA